jgi:hypothetical protein
MARAVISRLGRRAIHEPLYDLDQHTGVSVEVFYVDHVLAHSFGARGPGWFWWTCRRDCLPDDVPTGPFANSYLAYRDMVATHITTWPLHGCQRPRANIEKFWVIFGRSGRI